MAMQPSTRANVVLSLVDKMSPALRKVSAKLDRMAVRARRAGMAMGAASIVLGTGLFKAGKSAVELDTNMKKVEARTNGITADGLKELNEEALRLGRESRYTAGQVSALMASLAQAGVQKDGIKDMTGQMLDFATATGVAAEEAGAMATRILNQFGMAHTMENLTRVTDSMTFAVNNSQLTLMELGEAMTYAGSMAEAYNQDFTDIMANLAMLGNVGVTGTMAGTTMNSIFRRLAEGSDALAKYGVEVKDATTGEMKNLPAIFREINEAMEMKGVTGLDKVRDFQEIFQRLGVKGAVVGARELDKLEAMSKEMDKLNGYTKETAKIMDSGMYGTLVRVVSAFDGLAIAIGNSIMPYVEAVAKTLTSWFNAITPFIEQIQWLGAAIAGMFTFLAGSAIGLLGFAGVATVLSTVVAAISSIFTGLMAAGTWLVGVISTISLPLVGIVAGVTALLALIAKGITKSKLFAKAWDGIKEAGVNAMNGVNEAFGHVVAALKEGDLELAWEIAMKTIDVKTRETLDALLGHWRIFVGAAKLHIHSLMYAVELLTDKIAFAVDAFALLGKVHAYGPEKGWEEIKKFATETMESAASDFDTAMSEMLESLTNTLKSTEAAQAELTALIEKANGVKVWDGTEKPFLPQDKEKNTPIRKLEGYDPFNDDWLIRTNERFRGVEFTEEKTTGAMLGRTAAGLSARLARNMEQIQIDQLTELRTIKTVIQTRNEKGVWVE